MTFASQTWVLKETIVQKLLVFERELLRRIFGSTKENQIWRIKTNEELDKLIKHKNIVNCIFILGKFSQSHKKYVLFQFLVCPYL